MTMAERTPLGDQLAACLSTMITISGRSQADLARDMGLSPKHINQMVNGKSGALAMYDYAAFTLRCRWHVTLVPDDDA